MFQDLVDIVTKRDYSLKVEFTPERTLLQVSDHGHRVVKFTTNLTDARELGEDGLAYIRIYERKIAQALKEDDPLEVEPVWLYYRVDVAGAHQPKDYELHMIAKVEESDGRIMELAYKSDNAINVCPGCGQNSGCMCPRDACYSSQYLLNTGRWLPISAPTSDEYNLLPVDGDCDNLYKKV